MANPNAARPASPTFSNPYVGPRPFSADESASFKGRDEEVRQLASLVIAHRVVLFHAASGAGKTSLIQAGLLPTLQARKKVLALPISRVSGNLPPGVEWAEVNNIFVFNTLINLQGAKAQPDEVMGLTLSEGLRATLASANERRPRPYLLILDQFEELFTTHPTRQADRVDFFLQLQRCLADYPHLSLLLSMREDYLARLDLYVGQLPDRLRTRFGIEPLSVAGALAAIKEPAAQAGRPFAEGVAEALVDNLRRIQIGQSAVDTPSATVTLGPTVEPVHLQIVCRQLWDNLPTEHDLILAADVQAFGNVDQALIDFYEAALNKVTTATQLPERQVRTWCESQLITPAHTRGLVYRGVNETEGMANAAVDILNNAYIIRADLRGSDTWYELAHDRLVEPILTANQRWRASYTNPLANALRAWVESGRAPAKLLRGVQLAEAEQFAQAHPTDLTELEQELLNQSRRQQTFEREQARQTTLRRRNVGIASLVVILLLAGLSLWALQNAAEARTQKATAQAAAARALHAQATAEVRRGEAESAKAQAEQQARLARSRELAAAAISNLATDPELSILLARQAISTTDTLEAENALHSAIQTARVQLRFDSHGSALNGLALSADAKRLATASADGVINMWDTLTGRLQTSIKGHAGAINQIAFSPNGKWLATAGDDGAAKLWEIGKGAEEVLRLTGHNAKVRGIAFSPDGKQLATSGYDATVRLWSLAPLRFGLPLAVLDEGPGAPITYALAFSPDSKRLAIGRVDGTVVIWSITPLEKKLGFQADESAIFSVAFSRDGTELATGGFHSAKLWDSNTGKVRYSLPGHTAAVRAVAFSPNGLQVATASEDQRVKVWNVGSGQEELTLAGHKGPVLGVAFTADDQQLATVSTDGTARLWNIGPSQELITLFDPVENISDLTFAPDERYVTTLGDQGTLKRWDLLTGQVVVTYTVNLPNQVGNDGFSADGRRLAIGEVDEAPSVWNLETATPFGIGQRLLTLAVPLKQVYHAVALDATGAKLATATAERPITLKIWDATTGKLLWALPGHKDVIHAITFSRDGRYVASASADRSAKVWDVLTGRAVLTLTGHLDELWDVAFSPDGKRLATASYDGTAKLWNLSALPNVNAGSAQPLLTITGHTARVASVGFSPNGEWLVTTSGDKTTKLWDAASGENLLTLTGHTAEVRTAVFSRNGLRLATLGSDQTIRLYTLDRAELLALAQKRVTRALTNEECQRYLHQKACP